MGTGELWVALLTTVGVALTLVGLGATWAKLSKLWTERWSDAEQQPWPTRLARWLRRMWNRVIRRPRAHGTLHADTPGVFIGAPGVEWRGSFTGSSSLDTRVQLLENRVRDLERSYQEEVRKLRHEVQHAVAEVTDEARAQWAESDAVARRQLRIALGWPAALIVAGTALQFCAACVALNPFVVAAVTDVFAALTPS